MILSIEQTGKQACIRDLWVLWKLIVTMPGFSAAGEAGTRCVGLACPLAAAVLGRNCSSPFAEPPPAGPKNHLSQSLSSYLPRDPVAAARPAPVAMETACTQCPPSPFPCPKPRARRPTQLPPRREPAQLGWLGAHEQRGPRDAGREESAILPPAPWGGEASRLFPDSRLLTSWSGSWSCVVGTPACSLGSGSRF